MPEVRLEAPAVALSIRGRWLLVILATATAILWEMAGVEDADDDELMLDALEKESDDEDHNNDENVATTKTWSLSDVGGRRALKEDFHHLLYTAKYNEVRPTFIPRIPPS